MDSLLSDIYIAREVSSLLVLVSGWWELEFDGYREFFW